MRALSEALGSFPETELYVYGHYEEPIDGTLAFVSSLTGIEELSVNLHGLLSLEPFHELTRLRSLSLDLYGRKLSLEPLGGLRRLTRLYLSGPASAPSTLSELRGLQELHMSGTQPLLDAAAHHPSLRRLGLHFGGAKDLSPLRTLPQLRDLEIWQIKNLHTDSVHALGDIPRLEALALGAARHVTSLDFLPPRAETLRYLQIEKVASLETLAPLAELRELRYLSLHDARPLDRSLEPLAALGNLSDLAIDDVYPSDEVDKLFGRLGDTRLRVRDRETEDPSGAGWRGIFRYVDSDRGAA